jgi:hypothetical protein
MRGRTRPALIRMVALVAVAALALSACGAKASPGPGAPGPTTGQPSPPSTIRVGDHDNGRTFDVPVGTRIDVVLGSTYWSFKPSSDPAVVAVNGSMTASPAPGCVPGGGCGTVTQDYVVQSNGTAVLSAHRTSCGEALMCRPGQRSFSITILTS